MHLQIEQNILEQGLSCAVVVARLPGTIPGAEFSIYRKSVAEQIAGFWKNKSVSQHPILQSYRDLHNHYTGSPEPAAPEKLLTYVRRAKNFTSAGAMVDCYNMVSARTLLSLGAHDLSKLDLPISLRICTNEDEFIPLGQSERKEVEGEYGYVDRSNRVICRMDVLQCEFSKATKEASEVIFFLQGNRHLSPATLLKGCWMLAETINYFFGGECKLTDFIAAPTNAAKLTNTPSTTQPSVNQLHLTAATVQEATPINGIADLTALRLDTGEDEYALAPTIGIASSPVGSKVLVSRELFPLQINDRRFDAYAFSTHSAEGLQLLSLEESISSALRFA